MLSVIVPLLNEEESLRQLHREIVETCDANGIDVEVIFVDDGSTDGSWSVVEELALNDKRVSGIRLRRNFAKAAALTAGMRAASGSLIMMMDADLQDDPAEIPQFLAKLKEGCDIVNGWKQKRLDPWHKVYPSKVFNWLVGRLTGLKLHDHNCGFKLFRAQVVKEIRIYGELHRFIAVLAHARGFRVTEIPIHHRSRQHGKSKYGVRRFLRGFLDLLTVKFITGFGQRPQHLLGAGGLFFLGLGFLGLGFLAVVWMLNNFYWGFDYYGPIGTRPLLAYSVAFTVLGAQAVTLGLLAELLVARTGCESDTYSIAERTAHELATEEKPANQSNSN
ncbi:MAG: glycosyltransferase family 2 protein [Planctomycetes bacterium]|nr:glycosyltransferase family 2 protein [Planctomycetota bacterium]